jgi:hypothetical protein
MGHHSWRPPGPTKTFAYLGLNRGRRWLSISIQRSRTRLDWSKLEHQSSPRTLAPIQSFTHRVRIESDTWAAMAERDDSSVLGGDAARGFAHRCAHSLEDECAALSLFRATTLGWFGSAKRWWAAASRSPSRCLAWWVQCGSQNDDPVTRARLRPLCGSVVARRWQAAVASRGLLLKARRIWSSWENQGKTPNP